MTKRPEVIDLAIAGELLDVIRSDVEPDFSLGTCVGMDTEIFFREDEKSIPIAKQICSTCPIREVCAKWAASNAEFGVFGGMTPSERSMAFNQHTLKGATSRNALRSELVFICSAPKPEVARRFNVDTRTVVRWRKILQPVKDVA